MTEMAASRLKAGNPAPRSVEPLPARVVMIPYAALTVVATITRPLFLR